MILPDVNVLIHAHDQDSPDHEKARRWWKSCLAGTTGIGLAWVTILGFVRITTHRRILPRPFAVEEALAQVKGWLDLPHVHIPQPSDAHFASLHRMLTEAGTGGNLTTDAHLASLAIEQGYTVYTTDRDFERFPEVRTVNPCRDDPATLPS